ncbi:MAG: hypothetical protein K6E33_08885 [Lachnospiraceae bacterium]|nr:hypothetical protein [Lachnospiraceae bacterium]
MAEITEEQYRRIYEMLDRVNPVLFDCGKICGSSCCDVDNYKDMGMYLLPGEEKVHDMEDPCFEWLTDDAGDLGFPPSWKGKVYFIKCHGTFLCEREKRPIQCRTYPAAPHIDRDGRLCLVYSDMDVPYVCPIIEAEAELGSRFLKTTYDAWKILVGDRRIYDLVKERSLYRGDDVKVLYTDDGVQHNS